MRKSTNFDLNLVEGSDLVNPLVQDVPNYEAIDEQMYKNECNSIGIATELKSGTVHALTRTIQNAPMFRFKATSNFTAGDTFTVDGIQVSALTPSGETLASNCYIIGSEVLCVLRETLLTVYVSGGVVTTAQDSEKLGGQLPEYYGTAEEVSSALLTAQSANQLTLNLQGTVENISSKVAKLGFYKLWENPNPDDAFTQQEITLSSDDYDFLLITCQLEGDVSTSKPVTRIAMKGFTYFVFSETGCENGNYPWIYQRNLSRITDTRLLIGNGLLQRTNGTSSSEYSTIVRPLTIYGGKLL